MEHLNITTTENLDKGQLEERLKIAQKKKEDLLERQFEFYDKEQYDLYVSSAFRFEGDNDRKKLYITAGGFNYNDVLENYKQYEGFKNNQLQPILDEIKSIGGELNKINSELRIVNDKKDAIELEEKFKKEKYELINDLYAKLDDIYSQIPQEAKDVGMNTQIAIKKYLPNLVGRAISLEYYIEKAEKIDREINLERLKDELKSYLS